MAEQADATIVNAYIANGCTECGSHQHAFFGRADDDRAVMIRRLRWEVGDDREPTRADIEALQDPPSYPCGTLVDDGECCRSMVHTGIAHWANSDTDSFWGGGNPNAPVGHEGSYRVWVVCDARPAPRPHGHAQVNADAPCLLAEQVLAQLRALTLLPQA